MGFSQTLHPYHLLLLLPFAITILVYVRYLKHNRSLFVVFRMISILFILLFLLGLQFNYSAEKTMTIYVADVSASTGYKIEEIEQFIKDSMTYAKDTDTIGILTFGGDVQVNNSPDQVINFDGFETVVNKDFTNISSALIYANALFETGYKKRIVLITDGYENVGDATDFLKSIPDNELGLVIHTVDMGSFAEVQISDVYVPSEVSENQKLDVSVDIYSNVETEALLQVYAGNEVTFTKTVNLVPGMNQFVYGDQVGGMGLVTYTVEIIPKIDTFSDNNRLSAFTKVSDKPYILMVYDDLTKGDYLVSLLEDYVTIEEMHTDNLTEDMSSLIQYDGFILVDVSAEHLTEAFMTNLQALVQFQGKGLLVTGGDNSYGPGGYFETPLEEMLPVDMTIEPKEETPNLGLVLVIDKSGSMTAGQYGVSKLELAKEAAIRGTEVLEANDQLGVIAFDDTVKWVIEMTGAEDKVALQDMIATIVPGGGTTIKPSLQAAVDALIETDTKLKHIILLTDGQAEQTGYNLLLDQMAANDISISTVAVGIGSDQALLKMLADQGNGRYYLADEFSNIPTIFAKEAFIAGEKYLNNINFTPVYQDYSDIMSGILTVPSLDGYVSTKMKSLGKLILKSPDDEPILAAWQYGLGRTVAWTSDVDGLWSTNWLNQPTGTQMFQNIFGWMIQTDINRTYDVDTSYVEGLGQVKISGEELLGLNEDYINGTILSPEGTFSEIQLEATAPGQYEGTFEPNGEGVYLIEANIEVNGQTESISNGIIIGYSPEYDFSLQYPLTAEKMVLLSGGIIATKPSEVFSSQVPKVSGTYDLSRVCLLIALLVFLFEIIIRKTTLLYRANQVIKKSRESRKSSVVVKTSVTESPRSHASDLLSRKQKRRD